jgi:hypothetical protein
MQGPEFKLPSTERKKKDQNKTFGVEVCVAQVVELLFCKIRSLELKPQFQQKNPKGNYKNIISTAIGMTILKVFKVFN